MGNRRDTLWRRLIREVRACHPVGRPVSVRLVGGPLDGCVSAVYDLGPDGLRIEIDRSLSWDHRVDCLIHEWAHALDHFARHPDTFAATHGPSWGVAYAEMYRSVHSLLDDLDA